MSLRLRYMRLPDIPQVVAIDRQSFDPPWAARSYAYEIGESTYSHMVVLERIDDRKPVPSWRRLVASLAPREVEKQIVGYGGLWHIADEVHISTIAVHPQMRGRGWGEIVLAGMVRRALTLDASYIVLEVRVSNAVAQNLYVKYGFETVATKPKYYQTTGEDAYDMRLNLRDDGAYRRRLEENFAALLERHQFQDLYTEAKPPRGNEAKGQ
jgi:ribosomal-protein-alanine N-acetyltransferase